MKGPEAYEFRLENNSIIVFYMVLEPLVTHIFSNGFIVLFSLYCQYLCYSYPSHLTHDHSSSNYPQIDSW